MDELYIAYLDGTLPDTLRQQVDAHLRVCPSCARGLEETRQLVADLHALSAVSVPDEFVAGVRARVRALPTRSARPWLRPLLAWGALAAAASVALVFNRFSTPPSGTVAQTSRTTASQRVAPATKDAPIIPKPDTKSMPKAPAIAAVPKTAPGRPAPTLRFAALPTTGMKQRRIQQEKIATTDRFAATAPLPARIEIAMAPPLPTRTAFSEVYAGADPSVPYARAGASGPGESTGFAGAPGMPMDAMVKSDEAGMGEKHVTPPAVPPMTNGVTILADKAASQNISFGVGQTGNAMENVRPGQVLSKNALSQAVQNTAHGSLTAEVQGSQLLLQVVAKPASQLTLQYADAPKATAQQVSLPTSVNNIAVTLPALPDGATLAVAVGQKDAQYLLVVPGRPVGDASLTNHPMQQTLQSLANAAGAYLLCPQDFAARTVTTKAGDATPLVALQQLARDAGYQFEYNPPWVNITR